MPTEHDALREEQDIVRWIEQGAPSPHAMWLQIDGVKPADVVPLTVEQAAVRLNVSVKTIRRRLPELAAMEPPGAYRIGEGERSPWRIVPAALEVAPQTVAPPKATLARGRRRAEPKKRSATRWDV